MKRLPPVDEFLRKLKLKKTGLITAVMIINF